MMKFILLRTASMLYVPYILLRFMFQLEVLNVQLVLATAGSLFILFDYVRAYIFVFKDLKDEQTNKTGE